jgi:hypothetical protein
MGLHARSSSRAGTGPHRGVGRAQAKRVEVDRSRLVPPSLPTTLRPKLGRPHRKRPREVTANPRGWRPRASNHASSPAHGRSVAQTSELGRPILMRCDLCSASRTQARPYLSMLSASCTQLRAGMRALAQPCAGVCEACLSGCRAYLSRYAKCGQRRPLSEIPQRETPTRVSPQWACQPSPRWVELSSSGRGNDRAERPARLEGAHRQQYGRLRACCYCFSPRSSRSLPSSVLYDVDEPEICARTGGSRRVRIRWSGPSTSGDIPAHWPSRAVAV